MPLPSVAFASALAPPFAALPALRAVASPLLRGAAFRDAPAASFAVKAKFDKKKAARPYRLKTHKATAKRIWITGTGKYMRLRSGKHHKMYAKSSSRRARLKGKIACNRSHRLRMRRALPYGGGL
jgi:large subunit ribosomal protein L35